MQKKIFRIFLLARALALFAYPAMAQATVDDLFSVSFPTAADGWACGRWGTILHSADGGRTWASRRSGTYYTLSAIRFTDSMSGWAVGDGGTILHSADGGSTWQKQPGPVAHFFMDIVFTGSSTGWIAGERGTILHTDDGGRRWDVQLEAGDFIFKSISFCDALNGWAVGEYGLIYHTADGGRRWERQAGSLPVSEMATEEPAGHLLFDVLALSPRRAWVVGANGFIASTRDAGASWQRFRHALPGGSILCAAFAGAATLYIGGDNLLARIAGDGTSLAPCAVEPPLTCGWVCGIAEKGSQGFVAVGSRGSIYVCDAAAGPWRLVSSSHSAESGRR